MMSYKSSLAGFKRYLERVSAMQQVGSHLFWDSMQKIPPKGTANRAFVRGILAEELFKLETSSEMGKYLEELCPLQDKMDDAEKALIRRSSINFSRFKAVPPKLFGDFEAIKSAAIPVWDKAFKEGRYADLAPVLGQVIDLGKEMCEHIGYEDKPHSAWISYHEEGMSPALLDPFFAELKAAIVPLAEKISEKNIPRPKFLSRFVPRDKQQKLSELVCAKLQLDPEATLLTETTHPFSFSLYEGDVRFTTRYHEDNFQSSLFATMHEAGHSIYSLNISPDIACTILRGGASAAFHESQSRFYENIVGRSREFLSFIYDDMMELYEPYIGRPSIDELYLGFNYSVPSLIRVEADELTYNLHIILRYEMERDFINGHVDVNDLPAIWNQKIEESLGLKVTDDRDGILQDIQWPAGYFGGFVSYALGNAYNAQILHTMKKDFDVFGAIGEGNFAKINEWLREHVHCHGAIYTPSRLIERITGEPLNPKYFINYITEKFTALYNL